MRKISVVLVLAALVGCGGKKDDGGGSGGGGGSAGSATKPVDKPVTCPPGNVVKDGACLAVITAEKVAVVAQQQSRLDELAKLIDQVETIGAPIELMNGIRQLEPWKDYVAKNERLKIVDATVGALDEAVKKLRAFKGSLGEASTRLGNLKGELDKLLTDAGAARRIEEVRAQVSSQLRAAIEPLAAQVTDTIQNALAPLAERFTDATNLVTLGCAAMALGRAGDKSKELCKNTQALFSAGQKYIDDFKAKPAALFEEVSTKLETELAALVDDQVKQALDAAQATVNQALRLPSGGAGSAGSAAGSATP